MSLNRIIIELVLMKQYKFYFDRFWEGFATDEQNNISFYKKLLQPISNPLYITETPEEADVIISANGNPMIIGNKPTILYMGEPHNTFDKTTCHILFGGVDESQDKRAVLIPPFISYLHSNNFLDRILNKPRRISIPPYFCCMLIGNPRVEERNNIFYLLNQYKKVHSAGIAMNNMGGIMTVPWGRPGFFEFISNYKFVIVGENCKMDWFITEKLFHGYLSGTVPIYWGSDHVLEIFNKDSMVILEHAIPDNYMKILHEVVTLDNDDSLWLKKVNEPIFRDGKLPDYLELSHLQNKVCEKIKAYFPEDN